MTSHQVSLTSKHIEEGLEFFSGGAREAKER